MLNCIFLTVVLLVNVISFVDPPPPPVPVPVPVPPPPLVPIVTVLETLPEKV